MIPRVIEVKHAGGYRLWLKFHDGVCGTIDLAPEYLYEATKQSNEATALR